LTVFIRIRGVQHYLWRAVDQHGVVLDILVQDRRNGAAAKRSSSACCMGCDTSLDASSPVVGAAMASLSERSSRMSGIGQAGT
jgi:hypothetical protein